MEMLLVTAGCRVSGYLLARASGVYSGMQGSGAAPEGAGAVVMFAVMGAFLGLVAGLLLLPVIRFISLMCGRNLGGSAWVVAGAAVGAIVFLVWALLAANKE